LQTGSFLSKRKKFIGPEMTVLDVISKHRETEAVFRQYDEEAGECICCRALFEPIRVVVKKYGLNMEKFMDDLNAAVLLPNREPDRKPIKGK
jgi:hypothetical protein